MVGDFRFGNKVLSDYAFGLNAQQFEVLTPDTSNPDKILYTINQFPRNLVKVKIQGFDIQDQDPANSGVNLKSFPFDLVLTDILEGSQGILIIENLAETKLFFEPTLTLTQGSDISINTSGTTVLEYIYSNGVYHFKSTYKPPSINYLDRPTLIIDNSVPPVPGRTFNTLRDCVRFIIVNARIHASDLMFEGDSSLDSVTVEIYPGLGEYKEPFLVTNFENIGVRFVGIVDANGNKPFFNATGTKVQFKRTVRITNSNVTLENLAFGRSDEGSVLFLAVRGSEVLVKDCRFENNSLDNSKGLIQSSMNSRVAVVGKLEVISASQQEGSFFIADSFSAINFQNVFANSDTIKAGKNNENGGMSIRTNSPITWDTIFQAKQYSFISVSSYIDGATDGTPRYNTGDILYSTFSKIESGSELTNNSTKFPG
ncbi:MAG: hypothetical protein RID09_06985 [Coleofasciculus sp. G1-WW12-02]|uniref:hypothetical protein n=1 Tax=Coleofasciculus sp. G1-WW12-02 TaxID=3068483 RepID=UPI003301A63C